MATQAKSGSWGFFSPSPHNTPPCGSPWGVSPERFRVQRERYKSDLDVPQDWLHNEAPTP
ncbi:MAG: hypothetical protein KGQ16_11800 [Cyanobacteria bacterium REEB444]|nr:hypothetical protein [Cyanobacteria bacterium REEB444]